MATYALLLEAARRPALQEVARRWTAAYLEHDRRAAGTGGRVGAPARTLD